MSVDLCFFGLPYDYPSFAILRLGFAVFNNFPFGDHLGHGWPQRSLKRSRRPARRANENPQNRGVCCIVVNDECMQFSFAEERKALRGKRISYSGEAVSVRRQSIAELVSRVAGGGVREPHACVRKYVSTTEQRAVWASRAHTCACGKLRHSQRASEQGL